VTITNGPNTDTVLISGEAETFKFLYKAQCASNIPCFLRDFEIIPCDLILLLNRLLLIAIAFTWNVTIRSGAEDIANEPGHTQWNAFKSFN
jgi:hypothetical protein